MKLTDAACRNAKPMAKPYKKADGHGLYLLINTSGGKLWRWKYRFMGKEKLLALGEYPLLSLNEARQKREEARKILASGIDPSEARKEEKRQQHRDANNTFEVIAREWHANNLAKWTENHAGYILRRLEKDIFVEIGHRPISEITPPLLLEALRKMEARGVRESVHRAKGVCGQVFSYAIATGRAEQNPAVQLQSVLKPCKSGHYAALEPNDLPSFVQTLERNDARLYPHTILATKLLLFTFVRTSELIQATWDEFDFNEKRWVIPAERMKMRQSHIVPLSKQAIDILNQLKELGGNRPYVFPSQIHPRKHMSNNTILKAIERMGFKGRTTGHGFRALAMSAIKEKLGYRHEVVDRQLAHAPRNKIDAAYDRAKFLDERRIMMQEWANYVEKMAKNENIYSPSFSQKRA